jgi:hypothetical protein
MREMFLDRPDWILSGSLDGWGAPIVPLFDLVIFVYVPTATRLERLRAREARRLGAAADSDAMSPAMEEFIDWASHYDDGTRQGRNLARHQAWLEALQCRVIRLDGTRPIPDLVGEVLASMRECAPGATFRERE